MANIRTLQGLKTDCTPGICLLLKLASISSNCHQRHLATDHTDSEYPCTLCVSNLSVRALIINTDISGFLFCTEAKYLLLFIVIHTDANLKNYRSLETYCSWDPIGFPGRMD